jgi:hypothetical protein
MLSGSLNEMYGAFGEFNGWTHQVEVHHDIGADICKGRILTRYSLKHLSIHILHLWLSCHAHFFLGFGYDVVWLHSICLLKRFYWCTLYALFVENCLGLPFIIQFWILLEKLLFLHLTRFNIFHKFRRNAPVYEFCCFEVAVLVWLSSDYNSNEIVAFLRINILTTQATPSIWRLPSLNSFIPSVRII